MNIARKQRSALSFCLYKSVYNSQILGGNATCSNKFSLFFLKKENNQANKKQQQKVEVSKNLPVNVYIKKMRKL